MTRDLVMRHDMKSMGNKAKILIDKLDFMKVLKNCAAKYKYQQSKKVTIEWEKIFTNPTWDKE